MTFEVDFTVIDDEEHVTVHTAWISAQNVTECKETAEDIAWDLEVAPEKIYLHISELPEWTPSVEEG